MSHLQLDSSSLAAKVFMHHNGVVQFKVQRSQWNKSMCAPNVRHITWAQSLHLLTVMKDEREREREKCKCDEKIRALSEIKNKYTSCVAINPFSLSFPTSFQRCPSAEK
jgi:hypothetical protein